MTALAPAVDPTDVPEGATIRRPDPDRPFVTMSNRKRWSKCALSAVLPQLKTPSGPMAEEGTEAHKAAEWALHARFDGANAGPFDPNSVAPPAGLEEFDYSARGVADWRNNVTDCAITYAQNAASLFSDVEATPGATTECLIEHKIEDVTIHGVRVYTIVDVALWNSGASRLVVGDYKFGRGPVGVGTMADPNEQCAGAAVLWTRERMQRGVRTPVQFGLFVYQPRTMYGEPWQVLAPMDRDWLDEQARKLDAELLAVARAAHDLADGIVTAPVPGDHCKYCPSVRWCPAAAAYGTAALAVESGRRVIADLTPEEVMALWSSRKAFDEFTDDLRERVRILFEQHHPAVQIKRRAGNRTWADEATAVEALMLAERYDLLRPAPLTKVEGALPVDDLKALTSRAPDVLTYVAAAGKDSAAAAGAFAKYLVGDKST